MSRSKAAYERLLDRIKRVVVRKNIQIPLARYLGKSDRYFTNLCSAKTQIPVTILLDIAAFCGFPVSWLLDKASPQPPPLPEDQLLFECEDSLPANPFLDDIVRRLALLQNLPVEKRDRLYCNRPVLEEIEEERFFDRASAQVKVEALAELLLADLSATRPGPLPARRLGELAAALGLWASIQRTHGLRGLAVKAFTVAFPLVRHSTYAWAHGSCLQRASHVLRDLDRPDLAMALIKDAHCKFATAEAWLDLWRTYVDIGTHFSSFPDFPESTDAYWIALEHLPASDWRFRAGAFQGLATNAYRQGMLVEARDLVVRGINECTKPNHIAAFLRWREAAILFDLGQAEAATCAFQEALNLMGKFASAGDIALVSLDYAEVLLRSNNLTQFGSLVREVTQWLPALRSNPILHRTLFNFIDLARLGDLSLEDVATTRRKVNGIGRGEVFIQS